MGTAVAQSAVDSQEAYNLNVLTDEAARGDVFNNLISPYLDSEIDKFVRRPDTDSVSLPNRTEAEEGAKTGYLSVMRSAPKPSDITSQGQSS